MGPTSSRFNSISHHSPISPRSPAPERQLNRMELFVKDYHFQFQKVDESGIFEGHAAVTGNVDLGGDLILPGAFGDTIKTTGGRVPLLWQHDRHRPIGVGLEMAEDDKGLWIKAQIVIESRDGADAYALLKAKAIQGLSIGYSLPPGSATWDDKRGIRKLSKVNVHEYSAVTFPMNPKAKVTKVKSEDMTERDIEAILRDGGLSSKEAKTLIASGFKALKAQRDVDANDDVALIDALKAIYTPIN
jgi:HK97 family phage prohead protease